MTGLEALKEFKGNNNTILVGRAMGKQHYLDCLQVMEKSLKALGIIKKKTVDIWLIQNKKTLKQYNLLVDESRQLTEEEYETIKEVLE